MIKIIAIKPPMLIFVIIKQGTKMKALKIITIIVIANIASYYMLVKLTDRIEEKRSRYDKNYSTVKLADNKTSRIDN